MSLPCDLDDCFCKAIAAVSYSSCSLGYLFIFLTILLALSSPAVAIDGPVIQSINYCRFSIFTSRACCSSTLSSLLLINSKFLVKIDRDRGYWCGLGADLFEFKALNRVLDIAYITDWWIEILASALASDFEAENFWLVVVDLRRQDYCHGVVHQENLREARTETSTVNIYLSWLWEVYFFATWAEILEATCLQRIWKSNWKDFLPVAEGAWTSSVHSIQKLLINFRQPARWKHEPGMNQAVQIRAFLIKFKETLILQVDLVGLLGR